MYLKLIVARILYGFKGLFENPLDMFKILGVNPKEEILEIGCAIGYHALALAEVACEGKVYAVDIWKEGLSYLKSKIKPAQNIEVICCSAEVIELPASSLDKVFCFDTLHEIPYPEQIQILSKGKLRQVDIIQGIPIFVCQ